MLAQAFVCLQRRAFQAAKGVTLGLDVRIAAFGGAHRNGGPTARDSWPNTLGADTPIVQHRCGATAAEMRAS